jgi:hypothetical protein
MKTAFILTIVVELVLMGLVLGQESSTSCPSTCEPEKCDPPTACLAGMVKDSCNCCYVCGQKEGDRCYDEHLKGVPPSFSRYSPCGENLVCRLRTDLEVEDPPEAVCYCSNDEPLCGSDGFTYDNLCKLTEARYERRDGLIAVSRGPCRSAPRIISELEKIKAANGSNVAFSCEAIGWPIPVIEWRVVRDLDTGRVPEAMPSDDPHVAVQTRGGPNNYEVSGWLQLLQVKPSDSGTYICVATNEEGEASSSAKLLVTSSRVNEDEDEFENEI